MVSDTSKNIQERDLLLTVIKLKAVKENKTGQFTEILRNFN